MKTKEKVVVFDIEISPNFALVGFKGVDGEKTIQIDTTSKFTVAQRKQINSIMSRYLSVGFNSQNYD